MKTLLFLPLCCSPAAAAAPSRYRTSPSYDLGAVQPAPNNRIVASLRSIDVFAVSWLDSSAMQYRLLYSANQRRQNYAESRWVAPPAELVGHALRKRMLSGAGGRRLPPARGPGRIRPGLRFGQGQPRPDRGAGAAAVAPSGGEILARRSFSLSRPAASADAGGGVAALAGAVEAFSTELHDWLGGLDRAGAPGLNIAQRCRS
jgi:cholesterol transport system auxiliary component